jgi:hypothetical protein
MWQFGSWNIVIFVEANYEFLEGASSCLKKACFLLGNRAAYCTASGQEWEY